MTEKIGTKVRENDFVFITNKVAKQLPELATRMWRGGVVKKVENGVAEVHITIVERVHVSKLTTGDDAYDPIP